MKRHLYEYSHCPSAMELALTTSVALRNVRAIARSTCASNIGSSVAVEFSLSVTFSVYVV